MTINERLKLLRKESGLTQTELAKKLKIGQTTIAAYENGTHDPQIFSLIAYADFFGCSVDYILGRESDEVLFNTPPDAAEERELLNTFHQLNAGMRSLLLAHADTMKNSELNK